MAPHTMRATTDQVVAAYEGYESGFAPSSPSRKRRKLRKGAANSDSEGDDPSFHLETSPQHPGRRSNRSARRVPKDKAIPSVITRQFKKKSSHGELKIAESGKPTSSHRLNKLAGARQISSINAARAENLITDLGEDDAISFAEGEYRAAGPIGWALNGEDATSDEIIEKYHAAWVKRGADADEWKGKHDALKLELEEARKVLSEKQGNIDALMLLVAYKNDEIKGVRAATTDRGTQTDWKRASLRGGTKRYFISRRS